MNMKEKLLHIRPHLILLFIPILFTLLFGWVMSPVFVQEIPVALLDLDHSEKARAIADSFYDCPAFVVSEDLQSTEAIEQALLNGDICGAIILPDGFGAGLAAKQGSQATVLIDGTNFLIGNNIQLFATTIFAMANASAQMTMLEAGGMTPFMAEQSVYTMNIADRALYNPQLGYFYYLFAGLLGIFVQQTFLAVTPSVLIQERGNKKAAAQKIGVFAVLNLISMLCCLILAHVLFAYPLEGRLGYVLLLHVAFQASLFGIALIIASVFDDVTHCIQFVMFLAVPTMLTCGYGWPEYMMAPGFAPVMKAIWPLYYYSNPMKDLMLKGAGWEVIGHYVIGGFVFAAIWIPLGMLGYRRKNKKVNATGLFASAKRLCD